MGDSTVNNGMQVALLTTFRTRSEFGMLWCSTADSHQIMEEAMILLWPFDLQNIICSSLFIEVGLKKSWPIMPFYLSMRNFSNSSSADGDSNVDIYAPIQVI
jgi:hypothetical protein